MQGSASQQVAEALDKATSHIEKGDVESAQMIFNSIQAADDTDPEVLSRLADLAIALRETPKAVAIFKTLVESCPDDASYHYRLAQLLMDDLPEKAESLCDRAIELNPDYHLPYVVLAYFATQRNQHSKAVHLLTQAHDQAPDDVQVLARLSGALLISGQFDKATPLVDRLLTLEPDKAETHSLNGVMLAQLGRFDEAEASYRKAIKQGYPAGQGYFDIAMTRKYTEEDDPLIGDIESILNANLPPKQRAGLYFGMGKIHDDLKLWDKAFEYFQQANQLCRPSAFRDADIEMFEKTSGYYSRQLFEHAAESASQSDVPVFIVGMPRSGTTLIEKIIASHPVAEGAGELLEIERAHLEMCPPEALDVYGEKLDEAISSGQLADYAQTYLDGLCLGREDAKKLVDKLPDNFLFLGFIHAMFPNAKIIHAVRSPLDTCLSCYFQFFREVTWSFDMEWIAERYRFYRKAMDYWNKILPEDVIIDVRYEDVVTDAETQAKRIIDFIGLDWDDNCLGFYDEKRAVNTASVWQVRQPIYQTSSKRWLNYAQHIVPLANDLREYLDKDDIEAFAKQGIKLKRKGLLGRLFS